ncbi:MAG TPA: universal stress protein [Thermoanaerobaculia bacterium]|nr:universal stress protein [Thermoanaerobaculia bacterium]
MKSFRRILFATDFSPASARAFDEAVALTGTAGAELTIVHVYQPPALFPADFPVSPAVYDELETKLREDAESGLANLAAEACRRGVRAQFLLLVGFADQAIAEAAREGKADLVVVGTHGRTGVRRLLLGSVASRVITAAPCPVMTVPAA